MNKTYRLIWSSIKEAWLVVAETVKNSGSIPSIIVGSAALMVAIMLGALPVSALDSGALPTGGRIVSGSGNIIKSGNSMTVNQYNDRMIANWSTFNIGQNAGVKFQQPGASSVALNRIQDQNPSQIMGSLTANGQIFLLNSSGIIFGQTAKVDVGGLVASSLNLANENFIAGKYNFEKIGFAGKVENQGSINAQGGVVALVAPQISNSGSISAEKGTVAIVAGDKVNLDFVGDGLVTYSIEQGAIDALAENKGLIKADGGMVVMTAKAADSLTSAMVNNSGVIEARTLESRAGRILLLADMDNGETIVNGTLDAGAPNGGDGGFVETSGGRVRIGNNTRVNSLAPKGKNGLWLIDPDGFTIAASGGDIDGATLSANLGGGDVSIASTDGNGEDGNINVNDNVSWSANKLTLTATNDVNINAVMTANDTASLDLEPGSGKVNVGFNPDGTFKGRVDFFQADGATPRSGTGFLTISGNGYTVINELGVEGDESTGDNTLQGLAYAANSNGYFALGVCRP